MASIVQAATSTSSSSAGSSSVDGVGFIDPKKCAVCGTANPERQYVHPPSEATLAIFQLASAAICMRHFVCSKCVMRAERSIERRQHQRNQRIIQRSNQNPGGHRSSLAAAESQPTQSSQDVIVGSRHVANLSNVSSDLSSVDNVTKRRRLHHADSSQQPPPADQSVARFPTTVTAERSPDAIRRASGQSQSPVASPPPAAQPPAAALAASPVAGPSRPRSGNNSSVQSPPYSTSSEPDADDVVPPPLRVKPSQQPRIRKQQPPKSATAVPRSPGGRPLSINEYVRSSAG